MEKKLKIKKTLSKLSKSHDSTHAIELVKKNKHAALHSTVHRHGEERKSSKIKLSAASKP